MTFSSPFLPWVTLGLQFSLLWRHSDSKKMRDARCPCCTAKESATLIQEHIWLHWTPSPIAMGKAVLFGLWRVGTAWSGTCQFTVLAIRPILQMLIYAHNDHFPNSFRARAVWAWWEMKGCSIPGGPSLSWFPRASVEKEDYLHPSGLTCLFLVMSAKSPK